MPLLTQWLQAAAKDAGSQRALIYRDAYLSWRGLDHRAGRRAQELRAMGLQAGQFVGLMLGNVPELVILMLALDRIGAISVPVDPAISSRDLDLLIDAAPLRALITRPIGDTAATGSSPPTRSRKPPTPLALRVDEPSRPKRYVPESRRRLSGSLLQCQLYRLEPAQTEVHDPRVVLFTTDAGGDPKGIVRGDAHLYAVADASIRGLGLRAGARMVVPTPFHYGFGYDFGFVAALAARATVFLEDDLAARNVARLLREESPEFLLATPAMLGLLADQASLTAPETTGARCMGLNAPGLASTAAAMKARWNARVESIFHAVETGPVTHLAGVPERGPVHPGLEPVGRPLPGVSLRVRAPDGSDVPNGTPGQLWIRSAAISTASLPRLPAAVRAFGPVGVPIGRTDDDGWLRAGEVAERANGGALWLHGREDDLVNMEGRRVALGEVEGCLESAGTVKAAEARVIYDDIAGPMVVARVVPSAADCRVEELVDHCARCLAPYKVPRRIELCANLSV